MTIKTKNCSTAFLHIDIGFLPIEKLFSTIRPLKQKLMTID